MKFGWIILILVTVSAAAEDGKTRVFVTDHDSWQESGHFAATENSASASYSGNVRRISIEQMKSLHKACPQVTITSQPAGADFVVVWDTKTWQQTSWSGHQNEYTVFNAKGDLVGSGADHKIANAAKGVCALVAGKK
jgi:hypothetical protein